MVLGAALGGMWLPLNIFSMFFSSGISCVFHCSAGVGHGVVVPIDHWYSLASYNCLCEPLFRVWFQFK